MNLRRILVFAAVSAAAISIAASGTSFLTSDAVGAPPLRACSDLIDNDGDGKIDYPADPGCTSRKDQDEFNAPPVGDPISPNDCSVDVSGQVQNWINSSPNGSTLSFDTNACYRIEATVETSARSNLTLLGNGVTFRSVNTPDDQRAFFRFNDSTGLVFRNMTIDGPFTQTVPPHIVDALQHAHGIDLRGSSAEIDNVTMKDLAGDCVYFGLGSGNSSGWYHDSNCSNISRNAASVVAGQNITVERVTTSGIGFIPFDVEPNPSVPSVLRASNIIVRNNTIGSYYLHAFGVLGDNIVNGVQFLSNQINYAGQGGAVLNIGSNTATRRYLNVTFSGNTGVAQTGAGVEARRTDGLTVTNNTIPVSTFMLTCSDVTGLTFSGNTPNTKSGCL